MMGRIKINDTPCYLVRQFCGMFTGAVPLRKIMSCIVTGQSNQNKVNTGKNGA